MLLDLLEELVDDLFLAKEEKVVDVGQNKAVARFCHEDVGFGCATVKSSLLKDLQDVSAMLLDCCVVRRLLSVVSIRCCPPGCRTPLLGTCRGPLLLPPHVKKKLLKCLLLDRSIRCCMLA